MLIRFRVKNFLSFKDEVELSMVAGRAKKHPNHVVQHAGNSGADLLRTAIVYGANASGKSNLIKAINFAKTMVVDGVRPKASIPRKPFMLDPEFITQPSTFEFEIHYKGKLYEYGFSLDSKHIHEEWLNEIRPKSEKTLFRRITSSDNKIELHFGIKTSKKDHDFVQLVARGTPSNRLFLKESVERNIKYFSDVYNWFEEVLLVIFPQSLHTLAPIGFEDETDFGKLLVEHLQRFDTGVCGFILQPISEPLTELPKGLLEDLEHEITGEDKSVIIGPDRQRYFVKKEEEQLKIFKLLLRHRDKSCEADTLFEMDEESDGTIRLLDLIPNLYPRDLEQNAVIIIDEIDRSLHPNLSYDYILTFLQIAAKTQLIVTTHESNLLDLDLIRRDEVWFVEKDKHGASSLYSLEEFSPRYDKDIRKGYMLGRFGAIPMIGQPNLSEN